TFSKYFAGFSPTLPQLPAHAVHSIGYRMRLSSSPIPFMTNFATGSAEQAESFQLGDEENFSRVRIFDLGAGCESFHINVFAGGKRTLHQVRLARNRNAIWKISFRDL